MKYKIFLQWGEFKKYPPREGEIPELIDIEANLCYLLDKIFEKEQNEVTPRRLPSASVGDIIELQDKRKFRIEDIGFTSIMDEMGS